MDDFGREPDGWTDEDGERACCGGDGSGGHHPMCPHRPRGIEIRGVIAMNGQGELCFFAHSRADGVGLFRDGGGPMHAGWDDVAEAMFAAPIRRVSHDDLAALDPPEPAPAHGELG